MSEKMICPLCGVDYKFFANLQEHECTKGKPDVRMLMQRQLKPRLRVELEKAQTRITQLETLLKEANELISNYLIVEDSDNDSEMIISHEAKEWQEKYKKEVLNGND